MSHIAEMARAEADRVEAEEPEPTPEPSPEPTPEPQPPQAQRDAEKTMRALEREDTRHKDALAKVLGDDFDTLQVCPLCAVSPSGYVPAFSVLPDDVAAEWGSRVADYFGDPGLIVPDYPEGRTMQRCPGCDGWGQVKTGARPTAAASWQCPDCQGQGFVPREQTPPQPIYQPQPVQTATGMQPPQPQYVDAYGNPTTQPPDFAGRPWLDPSYGHPITAPAPGATP